MSITQKWEEGNKIQYISPNKDRPALVRMSKTLSVAGSVNDDCSTGMRVSASVGWSEGYFVTFWLVKIFVTFLNDDFRYL